MAAELIANATSEPPSGHSRSAESSSRERSVTRPLPTKHPPSVRGADLKPAYEMPAAKARARVHLDLEPHRFP